MKFDRPVCMEHEEPGRGASFERLISYRQFAEAAELLEPGVTIPFRVLGNDEASWLAAHMPPTLRLDRDGDSYWYVSAEAARPQEFQAVRL